MNKRNRILTVILVLAIVCTVAGPAVASSLTRNATLTYRDIHITLDGTEVLPTDVNGNYVEPFIIDGTTYLPVRGIASALGLNVAWDADTSTVQLYSEPTEGAPVGPAQVDTWTQIPYPSDWYGAVLISNNGDNSPAALIDVYGKIGYVDGRPYLELYPIDSPYEALDTKWIDTDPVYPVVSMWIVQDDTRIVPDIRTDEPGEAWVAYTDMTPDDSAMVTTSLDNGGLYFYLPGLTSDYDGTTYDVTIFLRGVGTEWDVATDPILPPSLAEYLDLIAPAG